MEAFGQLPNTMDSDKLWDLRFKLIAEEVLELKNATTKEDILDALIDILYVTYGAGLAFNFDMQGAFDEVHKSNMSKLSEDGTPIYREDGKVLKGPNYFKPDLRKFV
ncbi:phosphoribosyl-ATP diphosphatase [bacterium]|nr:phosphoribosyl-ATP diphosphatase [bacterium]